MSQNVVKEYGQLQFTDDFMFCKVLENNEDLCKELLELILGKKIRKITYLAKQKVIDITSDGKGIRLDEAVDKARNKEEWRMEYMTLLMRDREKFEQGLEQGLAQGRMDVLQSLIRKGCTKDFIYDLGYTEEEYAKAEDSLLQKDDS